MKRILALFLWIMLCLSTFPSAAEEITPHDFVTQQGFAIAETFDSPGWRTCYLIETSDTQTLTFSNETTAYCIVGTPLLDQNYDISIIRDLFLDLLNKFEWDVSYYWPDYENEDKIAVSYGITQALDKTKLNCDDFNEYTLWLKLKFITDYPTLSASSDAISTEDDTATSWLICENLTLDGETVSEELSGMACAVFSIAPGGSFAGINNEPFPYHLFSATLSDAQIMSYFGRMIDYVYANATSIWGDALQRGITNQTILIGAQLNNGSVYSGKYNIATREMVISYSD